MKDTTRRILHALMTNALAKTFNFKGHGTKHAFEDLTLKDITNGEQTSANLFGVASIVDTHISCCELFHVFLSGELFATILHLSREIDDCMAA